MQLLLKRARAVKVNLKNIKREDTEQKSASLLGSEKNWGFCT